MRESNAFMMVPYFTVQGVSKIFDGDYAKAEDHS